MLIIDLLPIVPGPQILQGLKMSNRVSRIHNIASQITNCECLWQNAWRGFLGRVQYSQPDVQGHSLRECIVNIPHQYSIINIYHQVLEHGSRKGEIEIEHDHEAGSRARRQLAKTRKSLVWVVVWYRIIKYLDIWATGLVHLANIAWIDHCEVPWCRYGLSAEELNRNANITSLGLLADLIMIDCESGSTRVLDWGRWCLKWRRLWRRWHGWWHERWWWRKW